MKAKEFTKRIFQNIKSNWFMPVIAYQVYSTDEQVIGVWTDGKPLYQKTVDCGAMPNNNYKSVSTGLSNVTIISIFGITIANGVESYPLPSSNYGNITYDRGVHYDYSDNTIRLHAGYNRSNENAYVTLQYTKTTDTSTTSKVPFEPLHEYSTEEKLVGYWIDGKPIFERVFVGSFKTGKTGQAWASINIGTELNIDRIISGRGWREDGGYSIIEETSGYKSDGTIGVMTDDARTLSIICFRYTKTTD